MNPTELIYKNIKKTFTEMTEQEVEIEFLVQMWLAAVNKKIVIFAKKNSDHIVYHFVGINIDKDSVPGAPIDPNEYYNDTLSHILANAVNCGYVHVIDRSGDGDWGFVNAHEVDPTDYFLYKMPTEDAVQFVLSLIDDDWEM